MEIIDLINELKDFRNRGFLDCNIEAILLKLKKIENGKKVKIPEFVADWIEYCKKHNFTLFGCLDPENGFESLVNETFEGDIRKCIRWCRKESNILAHAWLDGYEVEEEKRYTVKMRATKQPLFYNNMYEKIFFSLGELATRFTRKELEEAGLSWVFDCPGVEVEEVEG